MENVPEAKPEPESAPTTPTVESLKEQGNAATKLGNYEQAMLLYTHAIKRDPKNFALYSNRSFAFLKMNQYSLAMEDAMQTILLNPEWAKGYFRRGEVQFAAEQYLDAQQSYELAFQLKPDDHNIYEAIEKARIAKMKEQRKDTQIPWVGAGIGIVFGVIVLIADYMLANNPTHPLMMAFATIAISLIGYLIAKFIRYTSNNQKRAQLEVDNMFGSTGTGTEDEEAENENEPSENGKTRNRYTKSQARQRFRKGKL